ncbi:MAG: hypothetical protein ACOC1O_02660 [bacterium]
MINGIVLTGILFLMALINIFFFEKPIEEILKHKIIIGIPIFFQAIGFLILLIRIIKNLS